MVACWKTLYPCVRCSSSSRIEATFPHLHAQNTSVDMIMIERFFRREKGKKQMNNRRDWGGTGRDE